jgi:hypothetical protein
MYATDNTTFINGIGVSFVLMMGVLMLVLPRRYALLPVVAMVCYMTMGQRLMIFGLNFTLIRLLMLFGFLRLVLQGELRTGSLNRVDRVLVLWVISSVVAYTCLWKTQEAFVNRLGLAYDALGLYVLFRMLVRSLADMQCLVRQFAWLVMPLALCMLFEKKTGHNPFSVLGGVAPESMVREGVLRCQGPFMHPILAGAFASALLPLFIGLWQLQTQRLLACLASLSAMLIIWTAASTGPLLALNVGVIGLCLWPLRGHMRAVRWFLGLTVLGLHLVMQAPVWFLIARASVFGGSTGYHRAILIDRAIEHFPDWWLMGTYSTSNWGYYMFDVTNQYVLIGVQGGLLTLILFLAIIARCFAGVGRAVHRWAEAPLTEKKFVWALGASLLVHTFNYISVPYFDQNIVCWYLLLAMIATLDALYRPAAQTSDAAAPQPQPQPQLQLQPEAQPIPRRAPDWTLGAAQAGEAQSALGSSFEAQP